MAFTYVVCLTTIGRRKQSTDIFFFGGSVVAYDGAAGKVFARERCFMCLWDIYDLGSDLMVIWVEVVKSLLVKFLV